MTRILIQKEQKSRYVGYSIWSNLTQKTIGRSAWQSLVSLYVGILCLAAWQLCHNFHFDPTFNLSSAFIAIGIAATMLGVVLFVKLRKNRDI